MTKYKLSNEAKEDLIRIHQYGIKKFISLFILVLFMGCAVMSQNNLKGKSIAFNNITENSKLVLSQDSVAHYFLFVNQDNNCLYSHRIPDSVLMSSGNPIENINIHFLDAQYGFIFGNECGYAFYPFILKTENGGKSWKRVLFEKGTIGPPLISDNFFMFDKDKGITIGNWNDESKFTYYLTTDGGESWKKKAFNIKNKDFRTMNVSRLQSVVFNESGKITVILFDIDLQQHRDNSVMILKSSDFGRNFEIVK